MGTIILAGGTGTMGQVLQDHFVRQGQRVVVLTRHPERHHRTGVTFLPWDARTLGAWAAQLEGATALINLAGRSVDCRYHERNKALIRNSRVDSTRVLGEAVRQCATPPTVWINLSTATIYRHAEDRPMDEATGEIGSGFSVDVAKAWEQSFFEQARPGVRQVAVRCAMVFSHHGGAFPRLVQLMRAGLGGPHGSGRQYVSWVHATDVQQFFKWLIDTPAVDGVINLAAPDPVPETVLLEGMRRHVRPLITIPSPTWLLTIGAFFLRTETELVLKSRRVMPTRALQLGYVFRFPTITRALDDLFAPGAQS